MPRTPGRGRRRIFKREGYRIVVRGMEAHVYDASNRACGIVWIDRTNAWNIMYQNGTTYLPINACLRCLGYPNETRCAQKTFDFELTNAES